MDLGYDESEEADAVLALSLARDGNAGRLKATVEMADLYDTSCRLTTKLETDYNALDTLREGLERLVEHRTGECFLLGL